MKKNTLLMMILLMIICSNLYAYLDAGTITMVIQAVIAFFLGVVYTIKIYWVRIKKFLKKKSEN